MSITSVHQSAAYSQLYLLIVQQMKSKGFGLMTQKIDTIMLEQFFQTMLAQKLSQLMNNNIT